MTSDCCEQCDDGDGNCIYPYYGVAPHKTILITKNGVPGILRKQLQVSDWPDNFIPDFDQDNDVADVLTGSYTHCLNCGRGPGENFRKNTKRGN